MSETTPALSQQKIAKDPWGTNEKIVLAVVGALALFAIAGQTNRQLFRDPEESQHAASIVSAIANGQVYFGLTADGKPATYADLTNGTKDRFQFSYSFPREYNGEPPTTCAFDVGRKTAMRLMTLIQEKTSEGAGFTTKADRDQLIKQLCQGVNTTFLGIHFSSDTNPERFMQQLAMVTKIPDGSINLTVNLGRVGQNPKNAGRVAGGEPR